jgi:signal peptidase II
MGFLKIHPARGDSGSTSPAPLRAYRSRGAWFFLAVILCIGLVADCASKWWAFERVGHAPVVLDRAVLLANPDWQPPLHPPYRVLPGNLLDLQLVINHGAVFGIAAQQRYFFIGFTLAALATVLLVFGRFTLWNHRTAHLAIGLILAGGIGNLYDRMAFGVVRDFLHMLPGYRLPFGWTWPGGSPELFPWVFNLADVMLLCGMVLLMIHINVTEQRRRRQASLNSPAPAQAGPMPGQSALHPAPSDSLAARPDAAPFQS